MRKGTYKRTPEILNKMRLSQIGKKRAPFSLEHKQKMAKAKIGNKNGQGLAGKIKTTSHKEKIRKTLWKGGLSSLIIRERLAQRKRPQNCELCGSVGRICFDHDHKTGKFRGWICSRCNIVLGFVKDNSELLIVMSNYLNNQKMK